MNKEEILQKSRNEKYDEGIAEAENKGRKLVKIIVLQGMIVFFLIIDLFTGRYNHALFAIFWASFGIEAYPMYKFYKDPIYLIVTISSLFASGAFIYGYFLEILN